MMTPINTITVPAKHTCHKSKVVGLKLKSTAKVPIDDAIEIMAYLRHDRLGQRSFLVTIYGSFGRGLAANGGLTFGNGGATVVRTTTGGHGLCLIQSGTTALAGNISYVQQ